MRRFFSILFIILLLFNVLGYYGLFFGLQYKHSREMIQRLDTARYNHAATITLKIPLAIPYASGAEDFERIDGEFEHNGEFYRLVKQRLSQDTLYIVCVKDHQSKRINQALASYVKTFTDNPVSKHQNTKTFTNFIKDYVIHTLFIRHLSVGWQCVITKKTLLTTYISNFSPSVTHPPECASA